MSSFSQGPPTLTCSSSSSLSGPTTPVQKEPLSKLFDDRKHSPPKGSDSVGKQDTVNTAEGLLGLIGKSWESLSETEQVQLAFLILKKQHKLVYDVVSRKVRTQEEAEFLTATELCKALNPLSRQGRNLLAFVRKGGDEDTGRDGRQHLMAFLLKHEGWDSWKTAPTVFNQPAMKKRVDPFTRCQVDISTVCYIISAATAILYYMCHQTGDSLQDAVPRYCINVGRYMRNQFTNEQVFNYIYGPGCDFPETILNQFLQKVSPNHGIEKTKLLEFEHFNAETLFNMVKCTLDNFGALVVEDFKVFGDYCNQENDFFVGNWDDVKDHHDGNDLHAFLIVGAKLVDHGENVHFLVQDSFEGRPFIIVGWDLLKSMGVREFRYIKESLTFDAAQLEEHLGPFETTICGTLRSGSPHSVPREITAGQHQSQGIEAINSVTNKSSAESTRTWKLPDYFGLEIPEGRDPAKCTDWRI